MHGEWPDGIPGVDLGVGGGMPGGYERGRPVSKKECDVPLVPRLL